MTKRELVEYCWEIMMEPEHAKKVLERAKAEWINQGRSALDWEANEELISEVFQLGWKNGAYVCLSAVERGVGRGLMNPVFQGEN